MSEIKVSHQSTALVLNTETLGIEITAHGETWRSEKTYQPHFYVNDKKIYLTENIKDNFKLMSNDFEISN